MLLVEDLEQLPKSNYNVVVYVTAPPVFLTVSVNLITKHITLTITCFVSSTEPRSWNVLRLVNLKTLNTYTNPFVSLGFEHQ